MAVHNSENEAKREEAIKLLVSAIQFPVSFPVDHVDDVTKQIVKGADILLKYIESGKTD